MSSRRRLFVGLVVDGRVGAELDGFRRALRGPIGRIPPHITIIAPLNIAEHEIEHAQRTLAAVGGRFRPFALNLGPGGTFSPVTPVVYLEVSGDLNVLSSIRAELINGVFAPPSVRNERPYVPHVTLGSHLNVDEANAAHIVLASYRAEAVFDRLVLFEQDEQTQGRPWRVLDEALLAPRAVVGRGGRELVFSTTHSLRTNAKSFFDEAWSSYVRRHHGEQANTEEQFAISCESQGHVIAVATGRIIQQVCFIDYLIVDATLRASGIGTALVLQTEQLARRNGCEVLRLLCPLSSRAATFFSGRGFRAVNELSSWTFGQDVGVFERTL